MKLIQIAIDGPASAGKSTIAKILASDLDYVYVDTGAMYRTVTLAALRADIDPNDEEAVVALLPTIDIRFAPGEDGQLVFLNDVEVTNDIRSSEVVKHVSAVASYAAVRTAMTEKQRDITTTNSVVMDGRDVGTTVLPNAEVKIFLIASVQERAERRYRENQLKGIADEESLEEIAAAIERRDYLDSHREISPLRKADDAVEVDTTGLTIAEVVDSVKKIMATKIN
ncbi:(d)CMP kinase [Weissella tructae]|nr:MULTISPECIES: (d)CMP kinase [Weissella]QVV91966.1 (d)CMP kinase [Weissella tructae]